MHILARNKRTLTYQLYLGVVDAVDSKGYKTGEKKTSYSDPVSMRARISAARGSTTEEIFGIGTDYTRTIITDNLSCPINEYSLIHIDGDDYCVVKVAKSLNHITYAVKEMKK